MPHTAPGLKPSGACPAMRLVERDFFGRAVLEVPSARDPEDRYLVVLGHQAPDDQCNCSDYWYRRRKRGEPCKHIVAARQWLAQEGS